jgi:hypothetical protein
MLPYWCENSILLRPGVRSVPGGRRLGSHRPRSGVGRDLDAMSLYVAVEVAVVEFDRELASQDAATKAFASKHVGKRKGYSFVLAAHIKLRSGANARHPRRSACLSHSMSRAERHSSYNGGATTFRSNSVRMLSVQFSPAILMSALSGNQTLAAVHIDVRLSGNHLDPFGRP